jgi:hypothetical protein
MLRALQRKPTDTNIIVFGLTRPGLVPTIYHTRGEHGSHYNIDAVQLFICHEDVGVIHDKQDTS